MNTRLKFPFHLISIFIILASLLGSAVATTPAYAATITVTSNADSGTGTLRAAITNAAAGDTINFNGDMTITLSSPLTISQNLTIDGTGLNVTVTGPGSMFYLNGGNIAFDHLTFANANAATGTGGAMLIQSASTVTVTDCTFSGDQANFNGGAIASSGTLTVTNSTFSGGNAADGGAIASSGTLTVSGSTFSNNLQTGGGGAIWNDGTATVSNSTFSGNSAAEGGAIDNLGGATLGVTDSIFSNNSQPFSLGSAGGAINNAGTATVTDSTFTGNSSSTNGGAILNGGTLTVTGSTFSANSTNGNGGGIFNNGGTVTMANSAFSGNSAFQGGGIAQAQASAGALTLTNSTFSGNSGSTLSLLIGTVNVNNTLVANSIGGDCLLGQFVTISGSHNLANDASCPAANFTQKTAAQIALGALGDHGGPTQVIPLLAGSAAIDAGSDSYCSASPVNNLDQRGAIRPVGAHCDIGAMEYGAGITLTVTNNSDSGAGSLRGTIAMALPGDTINFSGDFTITLASELAISKDLTISGAGHSVAVDGNNAVRVFDVTGGNVNFDTLTIENGLVHVLDCPDGHGGVDMGHYCGGGIIIKSSSSTVTVSNSTLSGNVAPSTVIGSNTVFAAGGGIENFGTLTVTNSTLSSNTASPGIGGGIANDGTLTVTGSTFNNNSAAEGGGAIAGLATISKSMFTGNSGSSGGAISFGTGNASITDSTFSGNSGMNGGAIENGGTLTVADSTFSNNLASSDGGSIHNDGTLTVTGSTFTGNSTTSDGGGIYDNAGPVTVANSTFSGNSATNDGGGIYNGDATATVINSTFSGNVALSGGGIFNTGPMTANNTIVAGSAVGGDCKAVTAITGSNNLVDDNTCGLTNGSNGNIVGFNPLLGPLADNGGPTQTMALLAGSVAIDAGNDTVCAAAPVNNLDQRGDARPGGAHCDIGAYEVQGVAPSITSANNTTLTVGSAGSFSVTATGIPTPALSETGALPSGVTFTDNGDGTATLSGTPGLGSGGIYPLTIKASNGISPDATPSFTLTVKYNFTGFLSPVLNPPSLNVAKPGSSVPLKFSLAGNQGMNIFAAGSPASQQISCTTFATIGGSASTSPSGMSGLTYNATTNAYTYSWKTLSSWKGSCRQFILTLNDGTVHLAFFKFK